MSQIYYADSSVLVKHHVNETGTDWLLELLDPTANNSIITSTLSIVEVFSALNRRLREAAVDADTYVQIAGDFLAISNNEYRFVLTRLHSPMSDNPTKRHDRATTVSRFMSLSAFSH